MTAQAWSESIKNGQLAWNRTEMTLNRRDTRRGLLFEALLLPSYGPITGNLEVASWATPRVPSSGLRKSFEGACFPFQVESLDDGVDDSIHGLHVDEADHGACSAADLDETARQPPDNGESLPQADFVASILRCSPPE